MAANKTEAAQAVTSGESKEAKIDSDEGPRTVSGNARSCRKRGTGTGAGEIRALEPV